SLPDHLSRFGVRAARTSRRGFSWQHRITQFARVRSPSALSLDAGRICLPDGLQPWTWSTIATPGYLPASPLLIRLPTTGSGPARPCPVAPKGRWTGLGGEHHRARYGRFFAGRRISTPCPSTTPVGYLTRHSLHMPAFSPVWPPPLCSPAASPPTRRSPSPLRLWTTKA